ncbi:hypothetical protein SAMN02745227_00580 [Anaerobranca californiensis DSM 14826]|uniref:AAA domain-containing protein n=1 Tax=Anaerobranca californiensis DSM 14826 TaxID=1120989 RepID=A0A1M6LN49_9FIRM|nr:hypothetical protein [Anaerobranca californiensis]SHJ72659.1 hypothetical protein SAMN02745227_00580 [Anaerobranca californiensis DSM 14826]
MKKNLKIAVVGNCAAGKTTLVKGLNERGYLKAYNVPQEHSVVKKLWQRYNPDILIYLQCSLEVAKRRRPTISWGEERLIQQRSKLEDAFLNKDIFIDTDNLSIEEVLEIAIKGIERIDKNDNS